MTQNRTSHIHVTGRAERVALNGEKTDNIVSTRHNVYDDPYDDDDGDDDDADKNKAIP